MREEKIKELKKYYEELKTINMVRKEKFLKRFLETFLSLLNVKKSFLDIEEYMCTLNNGYTIKREKLIKNKKDGSAAIILPITVNNEVILAVEPRVFTKETVDVGLPAGYIEDNELPEVSAIRELQEETGYTSEDLVCLGSYYQDQGCSGALNYYYIARNCKKMGNQNLDEGEFIKYILVSMEELEELLKDGYIKGLNSAYLITASLNILNKEDIRSYKNILKP